MMCHDDRVWAESARIVVIFRAQGALLVSTSEDEDAPCTPTASAKVPLHRVDYVRLELWPALVLPGAECRGAVHIQGGRLSS